MKDPNVDAVVVATPTDQHESFVRTALTAGKAVFCEKPIAATKQAIGKCYDLAAKVNRPLFCAFNRRFDAGMSTLRQKVRDQQIGTVYQVRTTSRDSPLPSMSYLKISRGIFHDCAVHDIDMVCWIVGEEPCGVFAQGSAFDPEIEAIGDVDTVAIILKFPSRVIATIELNRHSQYGYDQRLEVRHKCNNSLLNF
jgi:myo-inositol 2-dehydrogenase/D-chiro-inositol 1-dehydrogenase